MRAALPLAAAPRIAVAAASPLREPALIAAVVLLAYCNSLGGAFQFDDVNVIVDNPVVHSWAAWWADLGHGIRPLLKLTYVLDWTLGAGIVGFHVFNVCVHVVNALLVFALARRFVAECEPRAADRCAAVPVAAALIFALHPALTEAVTYVSGRSSSLMAMFYLASLLAYASARAGALAPRAASLLLFALAVATKETAITLPLALLLWEAVRGRRPPWREVLRRQLGHWILLAALALLWLAPVYGERLVPDLDRQAILSNLLVQVDAIVYLAARLALVLPANIDPDLRPVAGDALALAAKAAALAAALLFGVRSLRRRPWWTFAILWFFLQLAPTNSLLPRLDLANDRQLYLAGIGPLFAVAIELQRLAERFAVPRRAAAAALATLLLALGTATVLRNRDYADPIRLWEQTARVSPAKARVFNNLAFAYGAAGCFEKAHAAYREALRLAPGYTLAEENLLALSSRWANSPAPGCRMPAGDSKL